MIIRNDTSMIGKVRARNMTNKTGNKIPTTKGRKIQPIIPKWANGEHKYLVKVSHISDVFVARMFRKHCLIVIFNTLFTFLGTSVYRTASTGTSMYVTINIVEIGDTSVVKLPVDVRIKCRLSIAFRLR